MIQCIINILRRIPEAFYLPIGSPLPKEAFESYPDIKNRIIFLGNQKNPPNMIRSMDLYLNDFPIGGELSVIEALAAGLPIVSMYDEKGLPPSRHAGHYIGKEHCVPFGDTKAYTNRACQLLSDKKEYAFQQQVSLKSYLQINSPKSFAKNLENSLLSLTSN